MKKSDMHKAITDMQVSNDYVVMDNAFSNPKFVKQLSKTEYTLAKTDTYTLKLFAEVLSRINFELLENTNETNQIKLELNIKDFLGQIGVEHTKGYNYVIEASEYLQTLRLQWKEKDGIYKSSVFVAVSEHNPKTGKINLFVPQQFAKRILDVGMKENFSFLKQNLFKLENNQAIRLYQFFKSWENKGRYETELERFKEQFGYNTSGYKLFSKFKEKVLEPAKKEINDKTDIIISYDRIGDNLEGARPRVKGLIFYITSKDKLKKLTTGEHKGERHTTETPQPQEQVKPQTEQKIEKNIDEPSEAMIIGLGQKTKLQLADVQSLITTLGNIRAWEILKSFIEISKLQKINNDLGYIHKSKNDLGVGLWEKEKGKSEKLQQEKAEKEKKIFIEDLNKSYTKRKEDFFTKKYNDSSKELKEEMLEYIKSNYKGATFFVRNNALTTLGINIAGEQIAERAGEGKTYRQNAYRQTVFNQTGKTIDFNPNDEITLP